MSPARFTGWLTARDHRAAVAVAVLGAVLLWARAPFAARNFYAEDGSRFYQDALAVGYVDSIGRSLAGYFHLAPRTVGFVTSSVPISDAALVNFLAVVVVVAWTSSTIYLSSEATLKRPLTRLGLAVSVTLLPIVGFESIANSANLHFLLLCASSVVLLGRQKTVWRRANDVVLIVVTGLSTPLLISLAPIAGMRIWHHRRGSGRYLPTVVLGWIFGVVGQLSLIVFVSSGSRGLGEERSLQRTMFLFLDRVIGYNFIPLWPRITSDSYSGSVSVILIGRALVCFAVASLIALLILRAVRIGLRSDETYRAVAMVLVALVGGVFWLFAGMLFSTEPRYAVFSAFCITWSVLIAAELVGESGAGDDTRTRRRGSVGIVFLLLLAFATHWTPSELRRTGPTWSDGLRTAEEVCARTSSSVVPVRILPVYADWWVELPCERIE